MTPTSTSDRSFHGKRQKLKRYISKSSLSFSTLVKSHPRDEGAELAIYIRRTFERQAPGYSQVFPGPVFAAHPSFPVPRLRKGVQNRVIIFTGYFNPPHIGHKSLVSHAFLRSPYSNTIAAMIHAHDERMLEAKANHQAELNGTDSSDTDSSVMMLSRMERRELWFDPLLCAWSWYYPFYDLGSQNFMSMLIEEAEKDGYKLSWVPLCGTDHMSRDNGCRPFAWGFDEVIVAGNRPAGFVSPDGEPLRVKGCDGWHRAASSFNNVGMSHNERVASAFSWRCLLFPAIANEVLKQEKNGAIWVDADAVYRQLKDCRKRAGSVWFCLDKADHTKTLYYLPIRTFGGNPWNASSTRIRKIVAEIPEDCTFLAVGIDALRPAVLERILRS